MREATAWALKEDMITDRGDRVERGEGEEREKGEREKELAKSLILMALATANSGVDKEKSKGMRTAAAKTAAKDSVCPSIRPWLRALSRLVHPCRKYQETRLVAGLLYR
jgi:hypothetical protein